MVGHRPPPARALGVTRQPLLVPATPIARKANPHMLSKLPIVLVLPLLAMPCSAIHTGHIAHTADWQSQGLASRVAAPGDPPWMDRIAATAGPRVLSAHQHIDLIWQPLQCRVCNSQELGRCVKWTEPFSKHNRWNHMIPGVAGVERRWK